MEATHSHSRGFHYDEDKRRLFQNPENILRDSGLRSGMVFIDIGCNDGFFTIPAAKIVGPKGKIYGVDVDANAIERLHLKADEARIDVFLETRVAEAETTIFCKKCADIIFYGTVLHDFRDPIKVLKNTADMLAPSGKLVNLDWKKVETSIGPPFEIRLSEMQAQALMEQSGLRVLCTKSVEPYFYSIHSVALDE